MTDDKSFTLVVTDEDNTPVFVVGSITDALLDKIREVVDAALGRRTETCSECGATYSVSEPPANGPRVVRLGHPIQTASPEEGPEEPYIDDYAPPMEGIDYPHGDEPPDE
jgi:hypothetical protein